MTNLPLENLKKFPNRLVHSKIHQKVDAAKSLLQRPRTKAMGAEETQEYTYSKDARLRVRGTGVARRRAQRVRVRVHRTLGARPAGRAEEAKAAPTVRLRVAAREGL